MGDGVLIAIYSISVSFSGISICNVKSSDSNLASRVSFSSKV